MLKSVPHYMLKSAVAKWVFVEKGVLRPECPPGPFRSCFARKGRGLRNRGWDRRDTRGGERPSQAEGLAKDWMYTEAVVGDLVLVREFTESRCFARVTAFFDSF